MEKAKEHFRTKASCTPHYGLGAYILQNTAKLRYLAGISEKASRDPWILIDVLAAKIESQQIVTVAEAKKWAASKTK